MSKNKMYVVRSIRMMSELIKQDFKLINVVDNKDNPHFKVFLFEDNKELRAAITEISEKLNN